MLYSRLLLLWKILFDSLAGVIVEAELQVNCLEQQREEHVKRLNILEDLLNVVKKQNNYNYFLIYNGRGSTANSSQLSEACIFMDVLVKFQIPCILMNSHEMAKLDSAQQSNNVLVLTCHYMEYNNEIFFNTDFQNAPHIILAEAAADISIVCQILAKNEVYHVIVLLRDFAETQRYYSCQLSGKNKQKIMSKVFNKSDLIIEDKLLSNEELVIYTHPDQMLPRSFVYYDKENNFKMDGYIGLVFETFAYRLKATLGYKYPIKPGEKTFFEILENHTLEGRLDVAAGLKPVDSDLHNLAYPVEFMDFCYMVPLPLYKPINELFFIIVDGYTMTIILFLLYIYAILITLTVSGSSKYLTFINIFVNDKSLRGLLGQSFILPDNPRFMVKFICFLIFLTSLLLNTAYQAFLQSYLTEPPFEKLVRTYDDMRDAGIRIFASSRELKYLKPAIREAYQNVFVFYDDYNKYVELREEMDTRYAYTVTRPMWMFYSEKQKYFRKPLFYYSSHLCLKDLFLVSMPVRPGWPYRFLFDRHIMQLREVGLMHYWTSNIFPAMLRFNQTKLEDLSKHGLRTLEIVFDDFLWIWVLFIISNIIAVFTFICEIFYDRFYNKLKSY